MISVRNITKSFGEKNVLNGLNLEIPRGETLVIMGRSGSGKSILLKIITGLIAADSGEIWFDGIEISKLKAKKIKCPPPKKLGCYSSLPPCLIQ